MKQENAEKRAYPIDHGLLAAINFSFSRNSGKLLENLVANEFLKLGASVTYFKQSKECDFIVEQNGEFVPFQVCYSLEDSGTKKREINGLVTAARFWELVMV
ncbi:MAG: ATP-binding protein [Cyclobacteriaceae bacterium]